jgi:hypothetical protein
VNFYAVICHHLKRKSSAISVTIEEAQRYLSLANNNLETALQSYYEQQTFEPGTSHSQSQSQPSQTSNNRAQEEEEEIRQPIERQYDILIEEESPRNYQLSRVRQQFSSSLRDLKREMEIQEQLASGLKPKRICLEDIYRNPIEIISNFDFAYAKSYANKMGKWVAVLVNDENFPSLSFNRDIFNEPTQRAKEILKKNFIFLRKNFHDEEAKKIIQFYNLIDHSIPIFLIIDSLTGELKKNFGDCSKLTLKTVVKELKKYTSSKNRDLVYVSPTTLNLFLFLFLFILNERQKTINFKFVVDVFIR